jgi:hypothetical protein
MATQKKRGDILEDLFNSPGEEKAPGTDELEKLIHCESKKKGSAEGKERRKNSSAGGKKSSGKKKSTHYLSGEIFWELDEAKQKINDLVSLPLRARVSKSQIVNQALKMLLDDFEQKKEKSALIRQLMKDAPDTEEEI